MMVKHEPHSQHLKQYSHEEDNIRWVTQLQNAKASSSINFYGQIKLRCKGANILDYVSQRAGTLPSPMSIYLNTIARFSIGLTARALRTNDGDPVARRT